MAELVKIDPKSIGVGQYQHDVDQAELRRSLDLTVESCVNQVGVNLNTASKHLLMYVSGLGSVLAQNIVDYRKRTRCFYIAYTTKEGSSTWNSGISAKCRFFTNTKRKESTRQFGCTP